MYIKDVRQSDSFDCGAVATAVACRVFGIIKKKDYFHNLLGTNGINGTDPRTIETFIRLEGLRVLSGEMDINDLKFMTKSGKPVISLVTFDNCGHYVVVYRVTAKFVFFHDPLSGKKKMLVGDFVGAWKDCDRFGVLYRQFGIIVWQE